MFIERLRCLQRPLAASEKKTTKSPARGEEGADDHGGGGAVTDDVDGAFQPSAYCVPAAIDDSVDEVLGLVFLFSRDDGVEHLASGSDQGVLTYAAQHHDDDEDGEHGCDGQRHKAHGHGHRHSYQQYTN